MAEVRVQTTIAASPEEVWKTVMDPERLGEWVTIHQSLKSASKGPPHEGAQMEQVLVIRGVRFTVKWRLTDCEAPHAAEWEGRGPAGSRARTRYELRRDGDNRTHFDYTNEFTAPGGMLGNVASRVLVGGVSEREAASSLSRLKALVEDHARAE